MIARSLFGCPLLVTSYTSFWAKVLYLVLILTSLVFAFFYYLPPPWLGEWSVKYDGGGGGSEVMVLWRQYCHSRGALYGPNWTLEVNWSHPSPFFKNKNKYIHELNLIIYSAVYYECPSVCPLHLVCTYVLRLNSFFIQLRYLRT